MKTFLVVLSLVSLSACASIPVEPTPTPQATVFAWRLTELYIGDDEEGVRWTILTFRDPTLSFPLYITYADGELANVFEKRSDTYCRIGGLVGEYGTRRITTRLDADCREYHRFELAYRALRSTDQSETLSHGD